MDKERNNTQKSDTVDHSGHRQRLKQRMMNEGLAHFEMHNVLELLLFYTIPRADTNETGHRLLEEFGSFANVLNADPEQLMKVPGVGRETALFLHMLPEVFRIYEKSAKNKLYRFRDIEEIANYLGSFFIGQKNEMLYILFLGPKNTMLKCVCMAEGLMTSVEANIRKIVSDALQCNAAAVVVAHNHPSGELKASVADYLTTRRIATALNSIDVPLIDHLIFANGRFESLSSDIRLRSVFGTAFRTAYSKMGESEEE